MMTKFPEKLRMKEQAEEDRYFAKRDLELIKAMHNKKLAKALSLKSKSQKRDARSIERDFKKVTKTYRKKPKKLLKAYEKLLNKVLILFHINIKKKGK